MSRVHQITRPYSSDELLQKIQQFLIITNQEHEPIPNAIRRVTVILWGHGNCFSEDLGFFKIFDKQSNSRFLLINDLLLKLLEMSQKVSIPSQLLMTQCWAHCHNQSLYTDSQYLTVDWLTSTSEPETSARRWDSTTSGNEMCQPDFDGYMNFQDNYDTLYNITEIKYHGNDVDQYFLLKYLHHSSIHIEAMRYLYRQRHCR